MLSDLAALYERAGQPAGAALLNMAPEDRSRFLKELDKACLGRQVLAFWEKEDALDNAYGVEQALGLYSSPSYACGSAQAV